MSEEYRDADIATTLSIRGAAAGRQPVALARVTASEYERPADGMAEARELLKV